MSPRRCRERPVVNATMEEEMRQLHARLDAMERSKGKTKIKSWDRMVAKIKDKFIPKDYQLNMFKEVAESETERFFGERVYQIIL
jgi:hypothetical protein